MNPKFETHNGQLFLLLENQKPELCPYCGRELERVRDTGYRHPHCDDREYQCIMDGVSYLDDSISLRKWNSRPTEDKLNAEIDSLKAENDKLENSIVYYALEIQVLKEAIRNCAIDRSLGGNKPVQQYIDEAWQDVKTPQGEGE